MWHNNLTTSIIWGNPPFYTSGGPGYPDVFFKLDGGEPGRRRQRRSVSLSVFSQELVRPDGPQSWKLGGPGVGHGLRYRPLQRISQVNSFIRMPGTGRIMGYWPLATNSSSILIYTESTNFSPPHKKNDYFILDIPELYIKNPLFCSFSTKA